MIDIDGVWKAWYSLPGQDEGEPEEVATLVLRDGLIEGNDPFGGVYKGGFETHDDDSITLELDVTKSYDEAETIFPGVPFPLRIKSSALITSPDFISMVARVNRQLEVVLNCRRIADPIG